MRLLFIGLIFFLAACTQKDCQEVDGEALAFQRGPKISEAPPQAEKQIRYFANCAEIVDYALKSQDLINSYSYGGDSANQCSNLTSAAPTMAIEDQTTGSINQPTNTQESRVDEADLVKISNRYIFYARDNSVAVLNRDDKKFVQSIPVIGHWRPHIYVHNEVLAVIRPYEKPFIEDNDKNESVNSSTLPVYLPSPEQFEVVFYDVKNKIHKIGSKTIAGHYINSRLSADGLLTVITHISLAPHFDRKRNLDHVEKLLSQVDCSQVARPGVSDLDHSLTSVNSFNLSSLKSGEAHKQTHLVGRYDTVYQNQDLYLTKSRIEWFWWDHRSEVARNHSFTVRLVEKNDKWTIQSRLEVGGKVLGSWSFKETKNHLLIATDSNVDEGYERPTSHLEVFKITDQDLLKVASIKGIAPGETLQSARFTDDYVYLVTFEFIDPLFIIDIKNPENPKLVSELKVPGFSSYLHDTDDGRLIGVGYQDWSLQLSLFDVLNPEHPVTLAQTVVGSSSQSSAQQNHHAFFFSDEWQLMGLPVRSYDYNRNWTKIYEETGAFFYNLSENKFDPVGKVSHGDWIQAHCPVYFDLNGNQDWLRLPGDADVTRVLRIDGDLMTFSDFGARVHDPQNPDRELNRTLFDKPEESCPKPYAVCTLLGG